MRVLQTYPLHPAQIKMEVEGWDLFWGMMYSQSNTPQATENKDVETEKTMEVEKEDKKNDEVHYQPNKYPSNGFSSRNHPSS